MRIERFGGATLYLGDCRLLLADLDLPSNAAVITDPPYGGKRFSSTHNSSRDGYGAELVRTDGDFAPVKYPPFDPTPWLSFGNVVLWGANHFCDQLPRGHRWLCWDKLAGKTPAPGTSDIELAWTSVRGPSRHLTHLWRGIMRAGEENVAISAKYHPHQKPAALMRWTIGLQPEADTVFDPYMGSGTTGVAAAQLGLRFVGCEIVPAHFVNACERIDNAYRQQRMFA